jgi:outer membrane protein OmpA-like peptidoglycan-associated protein
VKASETGKIEEAADLLSQYPIAAVSIVGYTDTVGTPTANDDLARRRADAVVAALRDTGVPLASSVAVIAAGETSGADQVDDPFNRRVDILITPHGQAAP